MTTDPPDDLERRVGQRVRELRFLHVWTQEELARRLSEIGGSRIYQSTVAKMEAGARPLRVNELQALATALDTTVGTLIDEASESARMAAAREVAAAQAEATRAGEALDSAIAAFEAADRRHKSAEAALARAQNRYVQISRDGGGQGDVEPREEA